VIRAAITIGSNSTRSLVAHTGEPFRVIHRGREETRLMLGMDEAGFITPHALENTVFAVGKLHKECLALGAADVCLMATSATRDAKNSAEFVRRLKEETGLDTRIISGSEEAELAFRAVAGREERFVIDIGGGSTELTYGRDGQILRAFSAQLGASRLLKIRPIQSIADADGMLAEARKIVKPSVCQVLSGKHAPMTGLGGTCTTCAAMVLGREAHGDEVEGIPITRQQVQAFLRLLAPLAPAARAQVPGVPASRVHHFPHGLCILLAVMEEAGVDQFTVSGRTNLDGYLMQFAD